MDKYEYNVKSDQIKKLYSRKEFEAAANIADEIDWYKVKDNAMISRVADIYENTKQYEKAKEILLIAYERSPLGRQLAYKLTILALRTKNFVEADEFYQDFVEMSPSDVSQYLLKYRIAKAKGEDIEVLIKILEAYVDVEMDERWQYELAKLYHEAGFDDKCIAMCDELELWFNDGKYVNKARELKKLITGVMEEYNKRYAPQNLARTTGELTDISEPEELSPMESLAETVTADMERTEYDESGIMTEDNGIYADRAAYHNSDTYTDREEFDSYIDDENNESDSEAEFYDKNGGFEEIDSDVNEEADNINADSMAQKQTFTSTTQEEERKALEVLKAMEEAALEAQKAADMAKQLVEEARLKVNVIREEENSHEVQSTKRDTHITNGRRSGNDRFAGMSVEEIRRQLDEEEELLYGNQDTQQNDSMIEIYEFDKDKEGKGKNIGDELTKTAEIDIDEIKINLNNDEIYNTANIQAALAKSMEKLMALSDEKNSPEARNAFEEEQPETADVTDEVQNAEYTGEEIKTQTEAEPESADEVPELQPISIEEQIEEEAAQKEEQAEPSEEMAEEEVAQAEEQTEPSEEIAEEESAQAEEQAEPSEEIAEEEVAQAEEQAEPSEEMAEEETAQAEEPAEPSEEMAEEETVQAEEQTEPLKELVQEEHSGEISDKQELYRHDMSKEKAIYNERMQEAVEEDNYLDDYSNEPTKRINRDEINRLLNERKTIYQTVPLSPLLSQGEDGQIGLAESEPEEEQIEGQMTLDDVLADIEKKHAGEDKAKLEALEAEEKELADIETEDDMEEIEESSETSEENGIWKVETPEESNQWKTETPEGTEEDAASGGAGFRAENNQIPEEYRNLFNDFVGTGSMEEDIARTLDNLINNFVMDGTSRTNNVIVTGSAKIGKTTLGLSIIKAANKGRNRSGRRVAKVKASVLNKRGVALAMTQILGTDLIIEQAGNMMPNTLVDLMIAMKNYTEEMLIVLEDDKAAIDRMLDNTPDLKEFFTNRLDIQEMEINDMVKIAKEYAADCFYEIDEMGELALYAKLDDISGQNPVLSIEDIQEVIDDAIAHANRFGLGKLFGKIRKSKGEMSVLTEHDFL